MHELLLDALARRGRIRDAEEHLAATARLFESESLDLAPIREAWRLARLKTEAVAPAKTTSPAAIALEERRIDGNSAGPRRARRGPTPSP